MSKVKHSVFHEIFDFYVQGFRSMTLGKTLWAIIFVKLFIMFFVLKMFFFKNHLDQNTNSDSEKPGFVLEHLTK